jgi:hypothetical protein
MEKLSRTAVDLLSLAGVEINGTLDDQAGRMK